MGIIGPVSGAARSGPRPTREARAQRTIARGRALFQLGLRSTWSSKAACAGRNNLIKPPVLANTSTRQTTPLVSIQRDVQHLGGRPSPGQN